ncbi:tRNA adenosine(34) deaminase TadA [Catenovulum maritimum]|uniref:tRNA-specific adenosine deaminase n=1 Tax=Catenovulum maritimum TaxID=1513271 RepID=A0A0J8GSG8_9ALTE|nr:tRNA adenosine(34) deaminase TadA [Catenovulum maritimum]KMT64239.1 hypothetical protein XM47_15275 [Catenovulum maritimum]
MKDHEYWMRLALEQAALAEAENEIPVGAIIVKDDTVIASAYNQSITQHDATGHAEIKVIQRAGQFLQNYRLVGCRLYVTLEPCSMCAGALVHSRLDSVIYGADDLKTGSCGSIMNLIQHPQLNHQLELVSGVLADDCGAIISNFFKRRRAEIKALKKSKKQDS